MTKPDILFGEPMTRKNVHELDEDAPILFGPSLLTEASGLSAVMQITLGPQGELTIRGPRPVVVEMLVACARRGLLVELEYLNWCG